MSPPFFFFPKRAPLRHILRRNWKIRHEQERIRPLPQHAIILHPAVPHPLQSGCGTGADLPPPENGTNLLYRMRTTDAGHRRPVRHGKCHKLPLTPHYAGGRHGTYPVRKQDAASKPEFKENRATARPVHTADHALRKTFKFSFLIEKQIVKSFIIPVLHIV